MTPVFSDTGFFLTPVFSPLDRFSFEGLAESRFVLDYSCRSVDESLDFGPYPSEDLICRLADALEADPDELRLLSKKMPEKLKRQLFKRLNAFAKFADLDGKGMGQVRVVVDTDSSAGGRGRKAK